MTQIAQAAVRGVEIAVGDILQVVLQARLADAVMAEIELSPVGFYARDKMYAGPVAIDRAAAFKMLIKTDFHSRKDGIGGYL